MEHKLKKAKRSRTPLHPRDARSPKHETWRRNISAAMRAAKLRRRKAGLLTPTQVAALTCLPVNAIRKMVASGELKSIQAGGRRYVPESELARLKAA